MSNWISG
jgi:hypothetical protein